MNCVQKVKMDYLFNTLNSGQNVSNFSDDIFKFIFLNWIVFDLTFIEI